MSRFSRIVGKFYQKKSNKLATEKLIIDRSESLSGIDLFAGAGGFSLAAKRSGITIRAAVEMDSHAASTYKRNFIDGKINPPKLFNGDINSIDFSELFKESKLAETECDVLLGGPPCQGFSTHRINDKGVNDPRNSLLIRYFDFVNALKPKIFVIENVPGLLWKRHNKYLSNFLELANAAGYFVHPPEILNSKDFGVPQSRKRVFIVGFRKDLKISLAWPPEPTHFSPDSIEVLKNGKPSWKTARTVFEIPLRKDDINAIHMKHTEAIFNLFKNTPLNGGSRHESGRTLPCHAKHTGHKDVYGRIDPEKPSPTMTTACINPSKGRFVHPTEHHGITARHAARFQTFPEDFVFEGGLTAAGVQIGNAVPIVLGEAVLKVLSSALIKLKNK